MKISLLDAGKRFNREWIFRHFNYVFQSPHAYAITGPNGSGKSTLLQFIAGALMPSEGTISYTDSSDKTHTDIYPQIAMAAPYLETVEEMTAHEFFRFHDVFKPLRRDIGITQIIERVGLEKSADKQIRYYSSGMKQRIKLAQAVFSDTPVLLLDEPTTNLDAEGISLYHELIQKYCSGKLIIVSSNEAAEYSFCNTEINMSSLKV
jgi:ABC-type multidrug transport system ATPase subunit